MPDREPSPGSTQPGISHILRRIGAVTPEVIPTETPDNATPIKKIPVSPWVTRVQTPEQRDKKGKILLEPVEHPPRKKVPEY